jgi:hypothetical protein
MRLWSLHPEYLDAAGLVALWREGLLAQKVLQGGTRGYTRHPQLQRFRACDDACSAIAAYLHHVADEADRRGYAFDRTKLAPNCACASIDVTRGQLALEWEHLGSKLAQRNPARFERMARVRTPRPHPSFVVVSGGVAEWERATRS